MFVVKKNIKIISLLILSLLSYNNAFSADKDKISEHEEKYISNYSYKINDGNSKHEVQKIEKKEEKTLEVEEQEEKDDEKSKIAKIYAGLGFQMDIANSLDISEGKKKETTIHYPGSKNVDCGFNLDAGIIIYPLGGMRFGHLFFGFKVNYLFFVNKNFLKDSTFNARLNDFISINAIVGYRIWKFEPYFFFGGGWSSMHINDNVKSLINKSRYSFNFMIGFGLMFSITKNWSVGIEYMMPLIDISGKDTPFLNEEGEKEQYMVSLRPNILNFNVRYNFIV